MQMSFEIFVKKNFQHSAKKRIKFYFSCCFVSKKKKKKFELVKHAFNKKSKNEGKFFSFSKFLLIITSILFQKSKKKQKI